MSKSTHAFWKSVSVIDATEPMTIFPKLADLEGATPGDPENCVYARCIRRVKGRGRGFRVRINRNIALVESKDKNGNVIAVRYRINKAATKCLTEFDQGVGELIPCTLRPCSLSQTLPALRAKQAKRRLLIGTDAARGGPYATKRPKPRQVFIRNGTGYVQYSQP